MHLSSYLSRRSWVSHRGCSGARADTLRACASRAPIWLAGGAADDSGTDIAD